MGTASCKCINEREDPRNWDERLIRSRNMTAPEEPLEAAVLCGESLGVMLADREKSGQASDPTFVRGKLVDKNGGCAISGGSKALPSTYRYLNLEVSDSSDGGQTPKGVPHQLEDYLRWFAVYPRRM